MKTKTIKLLFVALLGMMSLSSCLKDNNNDLINVPQGAFTMMNAYTSTPAVRYLFDNKYTDHIAYKSYVSALAYAGKRRISIVSTNNELIVDTLYSIKNGAYYTSFVYGTGKKAKHIITQDSLLKDLGNTNAGLRFLHLAENTDKVNVYFNSKETPIFKDRAVQDPILTEENIKDTWFQPGVSGMQNIIVTDANNNTLLERKFEFKAGKYYTISLVGDKNKTNTPLYIGVLEQYK